MNKMDIAKSLIREEVLAHFNKSKASDYQEGINSFKQSDPELQKRKKQSEETSTKDQQKKAYQASKETQKINHAENKIKRKTDSLNKKGTVGKLLKRGAEKIKEHFKDPEETSNLIPKCNMPGANPLKRLNLVQPQKQKQVTKSQPISKSGPIVHSVTILGNGPHLKP